MIAEINYVCKNCGSKELSSWDWGIDDDSPRDWTFFCYCSECGIEFEANHENSVIGLIK